MVILCTVRTRDRAEIHVRAMETVLAVCGANAVTSTGATGGVPRETLAVTVSLWSVSGSELLQGWSERRDESGARDASGVGPRLRVQNCCDGARGVESELS